MKKTTKRNPARLALLLLGQAIRKELATKLDAIKTAQLYMEHGAVQAYACD